MRRGADGSFIFDAISATDWSSPETLEHWREAWAELCNAKFAEKGLDSRIDRRCYERQGIDQRPTVHEGVTEAAPSIIDNFSFTPPPGDFFSQEMQFSLAARPIALDKTRQLRLG